MLTVLVVDDERIIREGLIRLIHEKCPDYRVVGEAADGEAALALTRSLCPDVAIVDIRMPVMGGIDYMRLASQMPSPPSFIALTGHADFEYARQLIGLGCVGYLLKPLKHPELTELMAQIAQKKKAAPVQPASPGASVLTNARRQEDLLRSLAMGQSIADKTLTEHGLDCLLGSYWEMLISVDGVAQLRSHLSSVGLDERMQSWYGIPSALSQVSLPPRMRGFAASMTDRTTVFLLCQQGHTPLTREQVASVARRIRATAQQADSFSITIGISGPHHGSNAFHQANEQCICAVGYRFFDGCGKTLFFDPKRPLNPRSDTSVFERKLLAALDMGDSEGSVQCLNDLFAKLAEDQVRKSTAVIVLSKLYIEIINILEKQGRYTLLTTLPDYETFETLLSNQDLFAQMRSQMEHILALIGKSFTESDSGNRAVRQAIRYVQSHMDQPIGAADVAQALGINASYFSVIFKKETGENFTNYVNRIKMEQAKVLLREPATKVYEVCSQVGFEDSKYFAKLFRRMVGMTPSEYREGKKKE